MRSSVGRLPARQLLGERFGKYKRVGAICNLGMNKFSFMLTCLQCTMDGNLLAAPLAHHSHTEQCIAN